MTSNKKVLHIESHYFPCIEYFYLIAQYPSVLIIQDDIYQKQQYRNRCYILGANKVESLTVPVHSKNKMLYGDVTIDHSQNWLKVHLRTIKSAYANSPYFEHYYPLLEDILLKRHKYLIELNKGILTLCLMLLGWKKELTFSGRLEDKEDQKVENYRNRVLIRKKDGPEPSNFFDMRYQQLFGNKFVSNLSILDLLFNEGVKASDYFSEEAYNNRYKSSETNI